MTPADPKNDWDSFEELHVIVELLELCKSLLRSRSHSKARAAVILLDHVADALMYQACQYDFEMQAFSEMVIPPNVPAKKRAEIIFRFHQKVSYLCNKKRLLSADDASVLVICHRVRNFAYHRNYHNPTTISVVGRILYRTVCSTLSVLLQEWPHSYSSRTSQQTWTKRYGVEPSPLNFEESSCQIADKLAHQVKISVTRAARVITADLSVRNRTMQRTLKRWLSLKNDRCVDDMLRHYEFADVHADSLLQLLEPVKRARYMVHDLHRGLPPEEWMKVPIAREQRREVRRAIIVAERDFKTQRRRLLRGFRQTVTARSLRAMKQDIQKLASSASLSQLLSQYDSIERRLTKAESYVSHAVSDLDFAIDLARGK